MARLKKNEKSGVEKGQIAGGADLLWRKPITLDSFEDEDPLETLYRGREVADSVEAANREPNEASTKSDGKKSNVASAPASSKPGKTIVKKTPEPPKQESAALIEKSNAPRTTKLSEADLKNILKIKSETFQFTDIREILRGKSFDMYAYLRFLSGDPGVCKIKHLDLMRKLDISRPTLFKQGDWLVRLSLIEKRNVPGDHLGTSYTVYRLEDVLPVSETLAGQIQTAIESFRSEND
ncbi:MAG TPA: hypothetical protein VF721_08575 [Pyrinomonadaceae bacterium]|jgi:hypothetical protein